MEEFCSGRKAGGWGVEWQATGLCNVLGGVLPAGRRSSGQQQWDSCADAGRKKKMNLTVRREPAGSSGSPGPIPIQSLSGPIRRTKSEP